MLELSALEEGDGGSEEFPSLDLNARLAPTPQEAWSSPNREREAASGDLRFKHSHA